jgi:hypothetical protein
METVVSQKDYSHGAHAINASLNLEIICCHIRVGEIYTKAKTDVELKAK